MLTPETTETLRTIGEGIALVATVVMGHRELRRRRSRPPISISDEPPERRVGIRRDEWNRHTQTLADLAAKVDGLVRDTNQDRWKLERVIEEREELKVTVTQIAADVVAIRVDLARMAGAKE